MKRTDQERQISPHAQEIEYALIVQRMINAVTDNPTQMRLTIYEFARARLKIDTSGIEESERERLLTALETAIQGVEQFSIRRENESLPPPAVQAQIGANPLTVSTSSSEPSPSAGGYHAVSPADVEILVPKRSYSGRKTVPLWERQSHPLSATLSRVVIVLLVFGIIGGLAYYRQFPSLLLNDLTQRTTSIHDTAPSLAVTDANPVIAKPNDPGFPLPGDYGIYALSNQALTELYALPERVPDKRIAVSTPVDQPSRTSLPDGRARFIVFRRDIVGNAPDRI